jgi:hypothetical protein
MKLTILLALAAIAAFLYFKPSSGVVEAPRPAPAPAADAPKRSIVVAPAPAGSKLTDQLRTGPNAQTELTPKIDRLKAGPNAQTDLTLKRSW